MTRYQRVEGNWISFTCIFGLFLIIYMLLFANNLLIISTIGEIAYFLVNIAVIALFFIPWMFLPPIFWKNRWFLRITPEGITDFAFGYKRFYPLRLIINYEVSPTRRDATGGYRYDLILKLESKTVHLQLDKYGINTGSEITQFEEEIRTLLLVN